MALAARCSRGFLAGMLPLNCHHGHRFCLLGLFNAPIMAGDG